MTQTLRMETTQSTESMSNAAKRAKFDLFYPILFLVLVLPVAFHLIFGLSFAPVLSNSMKPVYGAGDLLVTKSVPAGAIAAGEIAVLPDLTQNVNYSHRVVSAKIQGNQVTFVTRGDANPAVDEHAVTVSVTTKVPKVVGHLKFLGWPIVFYLHHNKTGLGFLLLTIALALGLIRFAITKMGSKK